MERVRARLAAGPKAHSDLMGELGVSPRALWTAIDRLKAQNLVQAVPDRRPGKRTRHIFVLTYLGRTCAPVEPHAIGQARLDGVEA
jgi:predicted ArsR family transcriptional regulator